MRGTSNKWGVFSSVLFLSLLAAPVFALPSYAVKSVSQCSTCHIEPSGWANPDLSERRCTLECQSCHISPAGGGLRTPDGQFYGREMLAWFGERPGDAANPEAYRPEGHPQKGRYSLMDGFSGWWPGNTPHTEIADRYGFIDPDPEWLFGGDFRAALLHKRAIENETFVFPMQADLYVANQTVEDLITYLSLGLQGVTDTDRYSDMEAIDYLVLREAFVKYRLPYNSAIRAGRIIPRFGWRTPDHTAFIRQDLGFDQYFQAFGVEALYNPNYLYADLSLFKQGLEAWPGDNMVPGLGSTFNVGYRELGWHAGLSGHMLKREDGLQTTFGVQWALNLDPFVYLGELDYRRSAIDDLDVANGLLAHHEWTYTVLRGLGAKLKYDWADLDISIRDNHRHRLSLGLDVHPVTFVNLEFAGRMNWLGKNPITNMTDSDSTELLLITHLWF
jgi:hypothetical protein